MWQRVKPYIRAMQRDDGVLILDDNIAEKPYTDENDIGCWHYDYAKDRTVKGSQLPDRIISLPRGITLIAKTEYSIDRKSAKQKRRSPIEKNVSCQAMLAQAVRNYIASRYGLNDMWFASAETMCFIKREPGERVRDAATQA